MAFIALTFSLAALGVYFTVSPLWGFLLAVVGALIGGAAVLRHR